MTKNEIAKNTNKTVALDYKEDYKVGQILTAEKAESWTDGGEFTVETNKKYEYFFTV